MTDEGPFSDRVAAAVRRHVNDHHPDDMLRIVRGLGGQPDASAASLAGISPAGALFAVTGGAAGEVTVPWAIEIRERADLRVEIVRMHTQACDALGIEPPAAEEH